MVRPDRFELPTFWFVARRSIQLSYGRLSVGGLFYSNQYRSLLASCPHSESPLPPRKPLTITLIP
jgi:hypothetical protein